MADTVSLVLNIDTASGKTAVKGLADEVKGLKTQADAVKPAIDNAAKGTKEFSDKATQTKGAVAALAAAMSMISPQAAAVVQGLGNVSGALGGVGKAAMALGASSGPLAILAVAVAAIATAWKLVGDQAKAAEQKQADAAKKAAERMALSNVKDRQKLEAGYKSGKIDEATYQETLANASGNAAYAGQFSDLDARMKAAKEAASGSVLATVSHEEAVSRKGAVKNLEKEYADLIKERADFINDAFVNAVSDAPKGDTAPKSPKTVQANKVLVDYADAIAADTFVGPLTGAQQREDALSGVTGTTINAGTPWLGDVTTPPPPPPPGSSQTGRHIMQGVGAYGAALSNIAGGNPGAALGMIPGPAGMITGALSSIGKDGAAGISKNLTAFKDAMVEALKALPDILTEVIPDFIEGFISQVIPALIADLPAMLKAILVDIPIAIVKGIADAIKQLIPSKNEAYDRDKVGFGDWLTAGTFSSGKSVKSYDVGTARVSADQFAMIHKDEAVLTPSQADAWRRGGSSGGGPSSTEVHHHYEINGPVGDSAFASIIEAQLSKRFGPGGVGYSTGLTGGLRSS